MHEKKVPHNVVFLEFIQDNRTMEQQMLYYILKIAHGPRRIGDPRIFMQIICYLSPLYKSLILAKLYCRFHGFLRMAY